MSRLILCFLLMLGVNMINSQQKRVLEVYPKFQRVIEGSRALFTCVSDIENANFRWSKPTRPVSEKRDGVIITQIDRYTSTLEIPMVHVKRHKRTFRCTVEAPSSGVFITFDASLKVLSRTKTNKNVPRITLVRQEDKFKYTLAPESTTTRVSSEIQCVTDVAKRPITWRWIRDINKEIKFLDDFESGKLQIQGDTLTINQPEESDYNTTYMCVAQNDYGTVYSQPIKINMTEAPSLETGSSCTDGSGVQIEHGMAYLPTTNPCYMCFCSNGFPTRCEQKTCAKPKNCQNIIWSTERCCDYECLTPIKIPGQCVAHDQSVIDEGEIYQPEADPCLQCTCKNGSPQHCASPGCVRPTCDNPQPVPSKCCEFVCPGDKPNPILSGQCIAHDQSVIDEGEIYQPDEDPCLQCTCKNGSPQHCVSPGCIPPPCDNPQPVPDRCCEFVCPDNKPKSLLSGQCIAYDQSVVDEGEIYQPKADPCLQCMCKNGSDQHCVTPACQPPLCLNPQPVPGKCCEFVCSGDKPNPILSGQCIAHDQSVIDEGEIYQPEADPCFQCTCKNGSPQHCVSPGCVPPPCDNPQPVPDRCCEFVCPDNKPKPLLSGQCIAYDQSVVDEGEIYQPKADPCLQCMCKNGSYQHCVTPACQPPLCHNPQPVPGKCCEFVCSGDKPNPILSGQCIAHDQSVIDEGEIYQPEADPCLQCTCKNGSPQHCVLPGCVPPPCDNPQPVPDRCCEFVCPDEKPKPLLLAELYVQQVGARGAIVHWNIPSSINQIKIDEFNVTVYKNDKHVSTISVASRMYALLTDLDPNVIYNIRVSGNSRESQVLATNPLQFLLRPRGSNGLVVSDAIGQVFESRGAIQYDRYSLPRQFVPLNTQTRSKDDLPSVVLNLNSFHRVEISVFTVTPCPNPECGMVRFYTFTSDGVLENPISLLFADKKDLQWAVSHL